MENEMNMMKHEDFNMISQLGNESSLRISGEFRTCAGHFVGSQP